jgi:hypothetical protein
MYKIVRVYITVDGIEKCIRDSAGIKTVLSNTTEAVDLDYHDERGHAHMAMSTKFAGKTVLVEDEEFEIPIH